MVGLARFKNLKRRFKLLKRRLVSLLIITITTVAINVMLVHGEMPQVITPQIPNKITRAQTNMSSEDSSLELPTAIPQGRAKITTDFLASHSPTSVAAPSYAGPAPEIDGETAIGIATQRAKWEWGNLVRFGTIIPLVGADGAILAYDVDFTIDGSIFSNYVTVASEWQEFCRNRTIILDTLPDTEKSISAAIRQLGSKRYGSITVAASYDMPPIISSGPEVSNFYASGWVTFEIAKDLLGTTEPVLEAIYLYGPWERAYRFKSESSEVVVEGQEPWSWYIGNDFQVTSKEALRQRKSYVLSQIQKMGIDSSVLMDSIRDSHKIELQKWLGQEKEGSFLQSDDHYIPGYNSYFVPFQWFGGCSPTAGAMVLNYYDEYYKFGRLTHWFGQKACPVNGDMQCHTAYPLSSGLRTYMETDNEGGTPPGNIYPGMVDYASSQGYCFDNGINATCSYFVNWCWDQIVTVIDYGLPFVWTLDWYPGAVERHSVGAVGYESVNKDIWCYNTGWLTGGTVRKVHYGGYVYQFSYVASPNPGCEDQYNVKLWNLDGYQEFGLCGYSGILEGGVTETIIWLNSGHPAHHVKIFFSSNGGESWSAITASTDDDNSYTWQVPCGISTEKARIMIQQFSSSDALLSSDGSYGDFKIIERVAPSAPSWCGSTDDNCGYINISWENVSDEDGYKVYRDGSAAPIGTTGANVTSYRDNITGTHSYRVKAYSICGESGYSPLVNGTGLSSSSPPSNCIASDNLPDKVHFSWQDNSDNEDGFKVYRDGSYLGSVAASVSYYDDYTASPGVTYSYCVKAYNNCGESGQCCDNGIRLGPTVTISGYNITSGGVGISGVTMIGLPGPPVTDGNGYYSSTISYGWSGTVTPTKTGYSFTPASRSYSNVTSNQLDQDYTGTGMAPEVVSLEPARNEIGAAQNVTIAASFNMALDPSSIGDTSFIVYGRTSGRHFGEVNYNSSTWTLTFSPNEAFSAGEEVTAILNQFITSASGTPMWQSHKDQWLYTTATRQDSSGAFVEGSTAPTCGIPSGIVAGDFNGDNHIDLATGSRYDSTISILLNDGNAHFTLDTCYSIAPYIRQLLAVDFDNDGDCDLAALSNPSVGADSLYLLENTGSARFKLRATLFAGYTGRIAFADLDGDGDLDLLQTSYGMLGKRNNLGGGEFPWSLQVLLPVEGWPYALAASDLDNDGDIDAAFTRLISNDVCVAFNMNGDGYFSSPLEYPAGMEYHPSLLTASDLNSDGYVDLVTSDLDSFDSLCILYNAGDGTFLPPVSYGFFNIPPVFKIADFDGDKNLDIAWWKGGLHQIVVFRNLGGGVFKEISFPHHYGSNAFIETSDYDGDGDIDIAASLQSSDSVAILINDAYTDVKTDPGDNLSSPGHFAVKQNYPNPFNATTKIEFSLQKSIFVELSIYDILGRKVRTLVSEHLSSGNKSVVWDGKNENGEVVSSGLYFYRIKAGDFTESKRMVLVK
jgi:hypothetical protein